MPAARLITSALAAITLLTGCAGYQVGPVNGQPAGARAVTIQIFRNDTFEPRLSEAVTFALRRRLQQDGTYRLDTKNDGDIIVSGSIADFRRTPVSFDPADIITPRDYELAIVANVTAQERVSGKMLLDQQFFGRTTIRTTPNRDVAERQAHPIMAEDLARNIASALTEGPW